jgi:hypothetical protein
MNINIEVKAPWQVGLIIRLYLPFIRDLPKYFLILEVKDDWVIFTSMTSRQESKQKASMSRPNKYIISYEPLTSKFFGSLINYNTLLVASKKDFLRISQSTYRGSKVSSPNYPLNKKDLASFKSEQINYFRDWKKQKRLTKIIFTLTSENREEWLPSYLKI